MKKEKEEKKKRKRYSKNALFNRSHHTNTVLPL